MYYLSRTYKQAHILKEFYIVIVNFIAKLIDVLLELVAVGPAQLKFCSLNVI